MPGVPQVTTGGPKTYIPHSGEFVRGGRLVMACDDGSGRIQEADAASELVLGVALTDAIAPEDVVTTATVDSTGRPVAAPAPLPTSVAVAYNTTEVPVTYAADADFGAILMAAADGTVTPWTPGPFVTNVVGRCTEPLGVTVTENPVGLARISVY